MSKLPQTKKKSVKNDYECTEQCKSNRINQEVFINTTNEKVDNFIARNSVEKHLKVPCHFNILAAIKRKVFLSKNDVNTDSEKNCKSFETIKPDTMELIEPLIIPDWKMLHDKTDISENFISNEELNRNESSKRDKTLQKSNERVHRKLEFSYDSIPSTNVENIESTIMSNCSMLENQDLPCNNSKKKGNKQKKLKRDTLGCNVSKSDHGKNVQTSISQLQGIRKENTGFLHGKKCKTPLAVGKADGKREKRLASMSRVKNERICDMKNVSSSSDSIHFIDGKKKLHEKILIKEGYKAMHSEPHNIHNSNTDILNSPRKCKEESKACFKKSAIDSKIVKAQKKIKQIKVPNVITWEQAKKITQKQKLSCRGHMKCLDMVDDYSKSVISNDSMKTKSNASDISSGFASSLLKDHEDFTDPKAIPLQCSDSLSSDFSPALTTNTVSAEIQFSHENPIPDKLLDPRRISFRDEIHTTQPEFCNLTTPDLNLNIRSKKRKQLQGKDRASHTEQGNLLRKFKKVPENQQNSSMPNVKNDSITPIISQDGKSLRLVNEESQNRYMKSTTNNYPKLNLGVGENPLLNNMATQTDNSFRERKLLKSSNNEPLGLSLSTELLLNTSQIEVASTSPYKNKDYLKKGLLTNNHTRTMSEISLHETTSSIKTESGTEISISTRGLTCSFNKYLDLEIAQLIKDENQRSNKIEMLFKSREKTLNDKTKKLVELEEQKRALRDTGQDSRISSVKKKQRALLLKLEHEKEEINRLKELHKIASQERKIMLQKQRNMFNPDLSTKNILHKLKRSADNHSPKRYSGPMKGYDIRSNSSVSSLIDSDKSQIDQTTLGVKSDVMYKNNAKTDQNHCKSIVSSELLELFSNMKFIAKDNHFVFDNEVEKKEGCKLKYDIHSRNYEEKMPRPEDKQSSLQNPQDSCFHTSSLPEFYKTKTLTHSNEMEFDYMRSESELLEEVSKISKAPFINYNRPKSTMSNLENKSLNESDKLINFNTSQKFPENKSYNTSENREQLTQNLKSIVGNRPFQPINDLPKPILLKNKSQKKQFDYSDKKHKSYMFEEIDFNESQSSLQTLLKHSNYVKQKNHQLLQDIIDNQNCGEMVNTNRHYKCRSRFEDSDMHNFGNTSATSKVSLRISRHSSNDSEKSFSTSVVITSHDNNKNESKTASKLDQLLNAREATLISRKKCIEEWIAWHARLREEEDRVTRMEQAAYRLVCAAAKSLSHNDSTFSSDTSDIEGRIEQLTHNLAERRLEMTCLKREVKKQAKKRLKVLESNLLNQIQKYDNTISEMRKKLETRKNPKEIEKMSIESRVITEYKVPEIPMKKIQEIYEKSNWLKSKTNISEKLQSKDRTTSSGNKTNSNQQYTSSDSELNEVIEFTPSLFLENKTTTNVNEDQKSIEVLTGIESFSDVSKRIINYDEVLKSNTEHTAPIRLDNKLLDDNEEIASDDISTVFSEKLDNIQIHNKELNDDLYNLEKDLQELSDFTSHLTQKTNEKTCQSIVASDTLSEKPSPSNLITENTLEKIDFVNIDQMLNSNLKERVNKIMSVILPTTGNESEPLNRSDNTSREISTKLESSTVFEELTEVDSSLVQELPNNKELPYKKISPNELANYTRIEDFVNSSEKIIEPSDSMSFVNTKLSTDIEKSIIITEETISHSDYGGRSVSNELTAENNASIYLENQAKLEKETIDSSIKVDKPEASLLENKDNKSIEENIFSTQESRFNSSTSLNVLTEEITDDTNDMSYNEDIFIDKLSLNGWNHSVTYEKSNSNEIESENKYELPLAMSEVTHEGSEKNSSIKTETCNDDPVNYEVIDNSAMFIPGGESTNLSTFILKLDSTSDSFSNDPIIGFDSDKFNDILEIIGRETKSDERLDISTHKNNENIYQIEEKVDDNAKYCTVTSDIVIDNQQNTAFSNNIKSTLSSEEDEKKKDKSINHLEQILNVEDNDEQELEKEQCNNINITKNEYIIGKVVGEVKLEEHFKDEKETSIKPIDSYPEISEEIPGFKLNNKDINTTEVNESQHELLMNYSKQDPEYEDISADSIEVSEILDRNDSSSHYSIQRLFTAQDSYKIKIESNNVLRILDDLSTRGCEVTNFEQNQNYTESSPSTINQNNSNKSDKDNEGIINVSELNELKTKIPQIGRNDEKKCNDQPSEKETLSDVIKVNQENNDVYNEELDTPRGISDIELDSPRDMNNSRLDVENLDDNLLSNEIIIHQKREGTTEFGTKSAIVPSTSEKDIETMIEKLKASLDQPGIELADLQAKLLRIEQLQIELAIKKLEAEEVSCYIREIPNKPPPPYTPPSKEVPNASSSPSLPQLAIIPNSVDDLTIITEKAIGIIFNAKSSGGKIMELEPPTEILESSKDDDISKNDRKIYNTFLFDLCKEIANDLYASDEDKPGPSWTKPSVRTKPVIKIPESIDELNQYVLKEVATLFGFKTKLQRDNMVMRWSRKRRDRVDELLAREAQAEEKEWTKFHHDELAVKNDLTIAILDSLIQETITVLKEVYAKKQKISA